MKRYPEYKNSQLDWVGEIPEHWKVVKFRYLSQESRRKNDDDIDREMLSLSSYTGIQVKQYESESRKRSKEESLTYLVVEPNQLVVNPMWQMRRAIGVSYLHGIVSPGYRVYYIDLERLIPQYLHYLMRSDGYVDEYNKHIRGLTTYDRSVKKEDFEEIGVLLPPKQEQTQIANFLDRKTEQIDELIHIKARMVELLQEERTALIRQTVTKGLDPNVEMKPSEVEYIGNIPKAWEVKKIKYTQSNLIGGVWGGEPAGNENDIYCIRVADFNYVQLAISTHNLTLRNISFKERGKRILKTGDLLIEKSGGGKKTPVGKTVMFDVEIPRPSVTSNFISKFTVNSDSCFPRYLLYCFDFLYQIGLTRKHIKQTTGIQNLDINSYFQERIPFPSLIEQTQIANFLNHKTAKIDELRSNEQRSLELLKEYRQTLISEVVTGKLDVRSEV